MSKEIIDELVIALEWALGKMESDTVYLDPHRRSITQIEADGMLPAQIYRARSAIAKAKRGERATELPEEYKSLAYLHRRKGCVETVKLACEVWTAIHPFDTVRVKRVIERNGEIIITGKCEDIEHFRSICQMVTAMGVLVTYEKTIVNINMQLEM